MTVCTADVAIVGGGPMGAWTAYFLARRGTKVTVLEKGMVGAQASGVNFGNLRLQGRDPGQYPLALRSHALWEKVDTLIGEDCEFAATGHLYIAADPDEHRKLEKLAQEAEGHCLLVERLSAEEVRHRWPWLGGEFHSGTFSARDATANPRWRLCARNQHRHPRELRCSRQHSRRMVARDRGTFWRNRADVCSRPAAVRDRAVALCHCPIGPGCERVRHLPAGAQGKRDRGGLSPHGASRKPCSRESRAAARRARPREHPLGGRPRRRVGAVLSELILDGETPTPLAQFSIGRFRHGVPISEKIEREFDAPIARGA
jgi:hypothetical protein